MLTLLDKTACAYQPDNSIKNVLAANIKRSKIFESSSESPSESEKDEKPDEMDGFLADKAKKFTNLVTAKINPKKDSRKSINPDDFVEVPKPDFSVDEPKSEVSGLAEEAPLDLTGKQPENPVLLSSVTKNRANLGNRKRRPPTRQKLKTTTDPDDIFKDSSKPVDLPDSLETLEKTEEIVPKSVIPKQGNPLLIDELRVKLKPNQKLDTETNVPKDTDDTKSKMPDNNPDDNDSKVEKTKTLTDAPEIVEITKEIVPSNPDLVGTSDKIEPKNPVVPEDASKPKSSGTSDLFQSTSLEDKKAKMFEDSDSDTDLFQPPLPVLPDQTKKKSDNLFAGFSSSDDEDLFAATKTNSGQKQTTSTLLPKKSGGAGLFDDDSDSDLDDLFSGKK